MEFLERKRWTSGTPDIEINYYYEYQRSGADMQYRVKMVIEPITSPRSFGYPIYVKVYMDGVEKVGQTTLKPNNTYTWSNNIEWTSSWITISNKTSGTTSLAFNVFSGNGSSRNETYYYNMYVAPAYASCSQSLKSKTETSITMNWSSDNTCDYLWYSKDNGANWTAVGSINATSGSYTISGLTANAPYNIKTRIRRKDSQLTTDSSALYVPTYNYPFAETVPNFNIESPVTIGIYNPLGRSCNVTIYGADGSTIKTLTTSSTSTGAILNDQTSITNLYNSIPSAKSGNYKVRVVYGSSTKDNSNGTYTAVQSLCNPTFSDFRFFDDDYDVTNLTGDNQIIVPRYSDVAVIISEANKAEARKGATMSKYQIKIGTETKDITYSSQMDVSGVIDNAPSGTVQVYAIDSRGYTTEKVKTASVIKNYTDIQRGNISIARQNNVGEAVTLAFNGTYWGESFGSVTNSITNVTYKYKKTTDPDIPESWADGTTSIVPTESNNAYSFSGGIVGDVVGTGFDAAYSYNIEVTVYDELSSTTFTTTLGSGSPNMAFVDGGVSFLGKYDESDTTNKFQINGNTKISGNETVTGNLDTNSFNGRPWDFDTNNTSATWIPVAGDGKWQHRQLPNPLFPIGTIYETTVNTNPGTWFGGTWTEIVEPIIVAWYIKNGGTEKTKKNINSITTDGRGTYQVNFSKNMADINYIVCITAEAGGMGQEIIGVYDKKIGYFKFDVTNYNGSGVNVTDINLAIFGTLSAKERYVWKRTA